MIYAPLQRQAYTHKCYQTVFSFLPKTLENFSSITTIEVLFPVWPGLKLKKLNDQIPLEINETKTVTSFAEIYKTDAYFT